MFSIAFADEYLPLMSKATGREIGKTYPSDGTPLTRARADSDKNTCLLDPHEVPNAVAARLSTLAQTDREAAEIEAAKAITACMAKKGWRIVIMAQ
jgi:hypothetical protein